MKSKRYCPMPFVGIEIANNGNMFPCCAWNRTDKKNLIGKNEFNINNDTITDYMSSEYMINIRQKMIDGEYIKECKSCYDIDATDARSLRQRKNERFIKTFDSATDYELHNLDIKLSNLCNQKCVICNPQSSSLIASEMKSINGKQTLQDYARYNWYKNEDRWDELKIIAENAAHFDFYGGEPWLIKKQWEFIKYLVDSGHSKHISLNYATNGSLLDFKWFEQYFAHFKHVAIMFSADGVNDSFEYNRFPAKWNVFERNVLQAIEYADVSENIWVGVAYTVSAFSIHDVINSLKFYTQHNIPVWFNPVTDIEYKPNILPTHLKNDIITNFLNNWDNNFSTIDNLGSDFFINMLSSDATDIAISQFKSITKIRDKFRKNNILTILPDLGDFLDEN